MTQQKCGKICKNGKPCTRKTEHSGQHGNGLCSNSKCAIRLTAETACPSAAARGTGTCRTCERKVRGQKPRIKAGSRESSIDVSGRIRPEYATVLGHWRRIFDSSCAGYAGSKHTPFYDGWNADRGGRFIAGMLWILENLGPKPKGSHLHVVPLNKGGKGFGPWRADDGGWSIRWLSMPENLKEENKHFVEWPSNAALGQEAKRRGFRLVPIEQ